MANVNISDEGDAMANPKKRHEYYMRNRETILAANRQWRLKNRSKAST